MNAPPKVVPIARRKFSLDDVVTGKLSQPRRVLGFGIEGCGKSTFGGGAPDAVFLSTEGGTGHLDIARLPVPESWDEALELIGLVEASTKYKTLVVDPVNWLEPMCWARVTGGVGRRPDESTLDAIEKYGGGFKKGYEAAVGHWKHFVLALERVWRSGKHVVVLAHAHVKAFNDPMGFSYDRYEIQLHPKAAGLLRQWFDDVLFMKHEVLGKNENGKSLAVSTGARVIHTQWDRAYDAKNRAGLPAELPLSWADYWGAVQAGTERHSSLKEEIATLAAGLDSDVRTRALGASAAAGSNVDKLAEIANRLRILTEQQTNKGTAQ